jgi:hypothetical protein
MLHRQVFLKPWQTGNVRGEHILAGDGDTHLKNGAHENGIGGLRAGTVDGRYLDAEIVDDGVVWLSGQSVCRGYL